MVYLCPLLFNENMFAKMFVNTNSEIKLLQKHFNTIKKGLNQKLQYKKVYSFNITKLIQIKRRKLNLILDGLVAIKTCSDILANKIVQNTYYYSNKL